MTTVQKLLGHRNVGTTMNYCEVADRTVVNELARYCSVTAEEIQQTDKAEQEKAKKILYLGKSFAVPTYNK